MKKPIDSAWIQNYIIENNELPIREYIKNKCPFDPKTQPKEYHNWYYNNIYKLRQSDYYNKKTQNKKNQKKEINIDIPQPSTKPKRESQWVKVNWMGEYNEIKPNLIETISKPILLKPEQPQKIQKKVNIYVGYQPVDKPTNYNLHKKIIKIIPGKYRPKPRCNFRKANITRLYDNLFQCNVCGQMWAGTTFHKSFICKSFTYDGDWWLCPNGCNAKSYKHSDKRKSENNFNRVILDLCSVTGAKNVKKSKME